MSSWVADTRTLRRQSCLASWTEFAKQAGEEPGSRKTFTTELSRRGFEPPGKATPIFGASEG